MSGSNSGVGLKIQEVLGSNKGVGFKIQVLGSNSGDIGFDRFEFSRFEFNICLDQTEVNVSNLFWIIGYFVLEISCLSCPSQVPP